ncbi:MAG: RNA-binding protein [Kangiella sp.]|nr:MAG: RNA-binding protein [Bacteroidota bacterium]PHS18196.1 MAG: RNA-binding protein [Kangiella sp.]
MTKFNLKGREFITLDNLLKIEGLCESGGRAKQVIADGQVKVNGAVELRKRCKIKPTQQIEFAGQFIEVVNETINQP